MYKYFTHSTVIELIWTVTPALVLVAIAFPSFRLLYLMDYSTNLLLNFIDICYDLGFSYLALIPMKKLNSTTTALVPQGIVGSTVLMQFNNYARNLTIFPKRIVSQLIGHLLGDGALVFLRTSITPIFVFSQTLKRFDYT